MDMETYRTISLSTVMTNKKHRADMALKDFGTRLAQIRKAKGYSQRDLAKKTGFSQRMIAYYEKRVKRVPATVLPTLAKTLGVSVDELLGLKQTDNFFPKNLRLWKKLRVIDKLPQKDQKALIQIIDGLLAKQKLNGV